LEYLGVEVEGGGEKEKKKPKRLYWTDALVEENPKALYRVFSQGGNKNLGGVLDLLRAEKRLNDDVT